MKPHNCDVLCKLTCTTLGRHSYQPIGEPLWGPCLRGEETEAETDRSWPVVGSGRAEAGPQAEPGPDSRLLASLSGGETLAGWGRQDAGAQDSPCLGTKSILTSARDGRASGTRVQAGPSSRGPSAPQHPLTHEVELGRQVTGKAFWHKAVVCLVCRRDVINGQLVDPTGQWWLKGPC